MDAGVLHACKASELARQLSDTELFLMVESETFPKSDDQRVFERSRFLSVSIVKRVEGGAHAVNRAIDGLLEKGFLAPAGSGVHATVNGNTVKHAFRDVRSAMSLTGVDAAETRSVRFGVKLRREMHRICQHKQAAKSN